MPPWPERRSSDGSRISGRRTGIRGVRSRATPTWFRPNEPSLTTNVSNKSGNLLRQRWGDLGQRVSSDFHPSALYCHNRGRLQITKRRSWWPVTESPSRFVGKPYLGITSG